jgi:hypothetical protein
VPFPRFVEDARGRDGVGRALEVRSGLSPGRWALAASWVVEGGDRLGVDVAAGEQRAAIASCQAGVDAR